MFCSVVLPAGAVRADGHRRHRDAALLQRIDRAWLGGVGSPSLMMIMCLLAASVQPARPTAAFFMPGSKSGMSPICHAVDLRQHHLPIRPDAHHAALRLAPQPLIGAVPK